LISSAPPSKGAGTARIGISRLARTATLRSRRSAASRRRLVLRVREWLGVSLIVCGSLTLFAVTFFSLLGR
jgi:hypothetical protein